MAQSNHNELIQKISSLGLKEKEAQVYFALLKLDKAPVGKISKETGLTKQNLYNYLEDLKDKNLAGETTEGGIKLFFVKDMDFFKESLMYEIEKKKNLAEEVSGWLEDYKIRYQPGLRCFRGKDEIQRCFMEQVKNQSGDASFVAVETQDLDFVYDLMGGCFESYELIRVTKKIKVKILLVADDYIGIKNHKEIINCSRHYDETRVVNKNKAMFGFFGLYIWADRVWFLTKKEGDYELLEVMNPDLVGGFMFYFDLVWKQAVVFYKSQDN